MPYSLPSNGKHHGLIRLPVFLLLPYYIPVSKCFDITLHCDSGLNAWCISHVEKNLKYTLLEKKASKLGN